MIWLTVVSSSHHPYPFGFGFACSPMPHPRGTQLSGLSRPHIQPSTSIPAPFSHKPCQCFQNCMSHHSSGRARQPNSNSAGRETLAMDGDFHRKPRPGCPGNLHSPDPSPCLEERERERGRTSDWKGRESFKIEGRLLTMHAPDKQQPVLPSAVTATKLAVLWETVQLAATQWPRKLARAQQRPPPVAPPASATRTSWPASHTAYPAPT